MILIIYVSGGAFPLRIRKFFKKFFFEKTPMLKEVPEFLFRLKDFKRSLFSSIFFFRSDFLSSHSFTCG